MTDSDPLGLEAGLAANGAAPLELAVAPLLLQLLDAGVPAPATQGRATIVPLAREVALPALGARRVDARVLLAERRRLLVVQEGVVEVPLGAGAALLLATPARGPDAGALGAAVPPGVGLLDELRGPVAEVRLVDEDGVLELGLQLVAHHPELRRRHPARLDLAGAGDAVALALHLLIVLHSQSSSFVVVEVDAGLDVECVPLAGVEEAPGEVESVAEVVRAAGPLPPTAAAPPAPAAPAAVPLPRAAAVAQLPAAAGPRHRGRHPRRGDRLEER